MTTTLATFEPPKIDGVPLPRGLREVAATMPWSTFTATYAPTAGPLRMGQWHCADSGRRATRLGPQTFHATLAFGDRIETAEASANGPVAALTAMLYDRGMAIEMLRFHQMSSGQTTTTFIQGSDGCRAEWAMGCSPDAMQSGLSAVVACANRLYTTSR